MITIQLMGGLGNQMFQIAAATNLALENNDEAVFTSENHYLPLQGRKADNYLNNILSRAKFVEGSISYQYIFKESAFCYSPIEYIKNMMLVGFFQSERYFLSHASEIRELFAPPEAIETYIQQKYGHLLNEKPISLHIRRGDYLKFHDAHPLCTPQYYEKAMAAIDAPTKKVLVFSDDISWCKKNLALDNAVYIEGEADYIDMYLMSKCKHNIIANSSFSWWGAWLNTDLHKVVVAPGEWFGSAASHDTRDLYCKEWKIV